MDEIVYEIVQEEDIEKRKKLHEAFMKKRKLAIFHFKLAVRGYEEFSWEALHNEGLLSVNDYKTIPELKDFEIPARKEQTD